jgi:hypothetical protein
MKHRWAAQLLVLALGALVPKTVAAQGTRPPNPPRERSPGFELGQNYPNPFSSATTIPFTIGDPPTCGDGGHEYRVTLRIYNVLAQLVAIPVLQGGSESSGRPVINVAMKCGTYTAYWNGTYLNTSQEISSGVYLYQIVVDGRSVAKKLIVFK